jgi:type IV pilus assembly protein PilX
VELMTNNIRSISRQRGLSLLYALLALAALAIAAVALVRSVSTSSIVAGNLAFKQEAVAAADQAVRQAVAMLDGKLTGNPTAGLDADIGGSGGSGYYASSDGLIDATGSQLVGNNLRKLINWGGSYCASQGPSASCSYVPYTVPTAINGNTAQYIIFRLCDKTGAQASANCARPLVATTSSGTNESTDYRGGGGVTTTTNSPYYRIVVRVAGARNTTSYTETIVHF